MFAKLLFVTFAACVMLFMAIIVPPVVFVVVVAVLYIVALFLADCFGERARV